MKAAIVGQPVRQRLEDQRRVEPRQPRAADVLPDIDAAEAEAGRLAQHVDREMLLLVPAHGMRRELVSAAKSRAVRESRAGPR